MELNGRICHKILLEDGQCIMFCMKMLVTHLMLKEELVLKMQVVLGAII